MVSGPRSPRLTEEARRRTQETLSSARHAWGWLSRQGAGHPEGGILPLGSEQLPSGYAPDWP